MELRPFPTVSRLGLRIDATRPPNEHRPTYRDFAALQAKKYTLSKVEIVDQTHTHEYQRQEVEAAVRRKKRLLKGLGQQVRSFRKHQGLTQEELAEKAGIGSKYIGEIERGVTNPTVNLLEKLRRALGIDFFELFLFPLSDNHRDSQLRIHLVRRLKGSQEKDLGKIEQILSIVLEP